MFGDYAQGVGGIVVFAVAPAAHALGGGDKRREQVGFVAGIHPLHDAREALEPHSRIHAWRGQVGSGAVQMVVELHEDEVPQLDIAVACVAVGQGVFAVGNAVGGEAAMLRSVVVMELGAGSARPFVAGGAPPVFIVAVSVNAVGGDAFGFPQLAGFVVRIVDGGGEFFERDAVAFGHKLNCEVHRAALEVFADAEVAEHLEQRVVGGVADLFDVGRAEALLRSGQPAVGRLRLAGEVRLELHHAGAREKQRRIAHRDERRAGESAVSARLEVTQKRLAQTLACPIFADCHLGIALAYLSIFA